MNYAAIVLIVFLFAGNIFANDPELEKIVEKFQKENNFNGTVLVATNGKIDFINSFGIADRRSNVKIAADSKFIVASMTKTFAAVLIMKLYEQDKIDLNATIGRYFPDYAGEGRDKVTIHQLLTYSSGIKDDTEKLEMKPYQSPLDLDGFIKKYCSGKLDFEPGSKSAYSNTEYIILGKIIENVTGKSFEKVLRQEILSPLKMKNTGLGESRKKISGLVKSYTFDEAKKSFSPDEPYLIENFFASGAMYSTAEDLLKFDTALFNNKLLKPDTTAKMLTFYPKLGYTAYGLWGSDGYGSFQEKFYYRTGGILGSATNWIHTAENKKTIIVLSNTNATNLYGLSEKLYLESIRK